MPTAATISERWVDIVPPVAPPHAGDPFVVGIAAALLLLLIGLVLTLYFRPRMRAGRALRRLTHELKASRVEARAAAYLIQAHLRCAFGQHQLSAINWQDAYRAQWLAYVERLAHCCFGAEPPTVSELEELIHHAQAWLLRKAVER